MSPPAAIPLAAVREEAFALWREVGPGASAAGGPVATDPASVARAARLLHAAERCCQAVAPASPGTDLTPRELEVLRLLADGCSDQEIARVLFVSPRTASTHVASIRGKLGVGSRAAAAAHAVRHRLI